MIPPDQDELDSEHRALQKQHQQLIDICQAGYYPMVACAACGKNLISCSLTCETNVRFRDHALARERCRCGSSKIAVVRGSSWIDDPPAHLVARAAIMRMRKPGNL